MDILQACRGIDAFFAMPTTVLFLVVGVTLTIKSRFIQFRALPRLWRLLTSGVKHHHNEKEKMINPFHALLTAMSTTIGMGNVVGPSIAIIAGGPGALFWLVIFGFFGAVTKFAEVMLAITLRKKLPDGNILGGPTQYLRDIHPLLGEWYGVVTVFLFAGWSGMQANTLASTYALEGISPYVTGTVLAVIVFVVLLGGIKRIGEVASKLVPFMFIMYVTFAMGILLSDISALQDAISLIFSHIFNPCAAVSGFIGATIFTAVRTGVLRNMYITESGLGTSSIAHSMADTDSARDQSILAMFSVIADMILSTLSGLLVIVTGIWMRGDFSNTLVYEVFKSYSPGVGKFVLLISITLFVLTTVIGNSYNASQSFASFTKHRGLIWYYIFLCLVIFAGALVEVPIAWAIMDILLVVVAVPHLAGVLYLSFKHKKILD
jgi:alanine or glycine:cation symporter, AGCS family